MHIAQCCAAIEGVGVDNLGRWQAHAVESRAAGKEVAGDFAVTFNAVHGRESRATIEGARVELLHALWDGDGGDGLAIGKGVGAYVLHLAAKGHRQNAAIVEGAAHDGVDCLGQLHLGQEAVAVKGVAANIGRLVGELHLGELRAVGKGVTLDALDPGRHLDLGEGRAIEGLLANLIHRGRQLDAGKLAGIVEHGIGHLLEGLRQGCAGERRATEEGE